MGYHIKADDEVLESPFESARVLHFEKLFYEECPAHNKRYLARLIGDPFCLVDHGIDEYLSGDEWTERLYMTNSYTIDQHLFSTSSAMYELWIDAGLGVAAIKPRLGTALVATMDLNGVTWRELISWCRFVWRLHGQANAG